MGAMMDLATDASHPVLDGSAFPHIIDSILDYLTMDHPAALALQTTCRTWHHKIRASVFAHIRGAVVSLDPIGPLPARDWVVTTSHQFMTVPPWGGRDIKWPAQTFRRGEHSPTRMEEGPALPQSLVAIFPLVKALDLQGPVPNLVIEQLYKLELDVSLVRMDDFFPGAQPTPRSQPNLETMTAYDQGRCPPHPIWYGSPLHQANVTRARGIDTEAVTIHVDISDMLNRASYPFICSLRRPQSFYVICCPTSEVICARHYRKIVMMFLFTFGTPVTLVGFETLKAFDNLKESNPHELWKEVIRSTSMEDEIVRYLPFVRTPSFMTHDEYEARFGYGTFSIHPLPDIQAGSTEAEGS